MALKATIHKAELEIVDMDRNYYATHRLTLACHPSETAERLMIRLLAFALNAHERLEFGKGISDSDEPDLWQKDLAGGIELWIELGHPDEKVIARAVGRSPRVIVYTYSANPDRWWDPIGHRFEKEKKLSVFHVDAASARELAGLADSSMNLQCSVQDGEVWFRDDRENAVRVEMERAR
ncbi:MAG TPA: YaeQ family protein [Spirochaetia bacterium]|nr:YaeQ family protein [Spirochaetia bacterium]